MPVLPAHELGVRDVSGLATLFGFTVSHRFSLPGLPAPYVVAQVAIEEDPRVRLTTSMVECDPEQLELGMRMEVVFEQVEDVWLPLFRPAAEQPEQPSPRPSTRCPGAVGTRAADARPDKFEDKVALTGIGMSRDRAPADAASAVADRRGVRAGGRRRRADHGRHRRPVDLPGRRAVGGFGEGGVTALEAALGIRPTWYNGGGETFGPGGSVIAAMLAVSAGLARHVLCFRTVWEATAAS